MIKKLRRSHLAISLCLLAADAGFFGLTNPHQVPSVLLIAGFALLMATLYWLIRAATRVAALYSPWLGTQKHLAGALSAISGLLIALQSIGQLTPRDFILLPIVGIVLYSYITYQKKQPQS